MTKLINPNPARRWEIRDALTTIVQQGGRVARPYTLSIRDPVAGSGDRPAHVEFDAATGTMGLNEAYFQVWYGTLRD